MAVESATLVQRTADLTRDQLMSIAVARGCRHYAPWVPAGVAVVDEPEIPHEVLGAALLRGSADAATFQAIRCGAMVLSDLGNSVELIAEACRQFGVAHRAAHIARLGMLADNHPEYWQGLLRVLPFSSSEESYLPGLSRLVSESRFIAPGRSPVRTWLRTHYGR